MENFDSLEVFSVDSPQSHFCKGTVVIAVVKVARKRRMHDKIGQQKAGRAKPGRLINFCYCTLFSLRGRQFFELSGEARDLARTGVFVDDAL